MSKFGELKPLEWYRLPEGGERSDTLIGRFLVDQSGWMWGPGCTCGIKYESAELAKAGAGRVYVFEMVRAFTPIGGEPNDG